MADHLTLCTGWEFRRRTPDSGPWRPVELPHTPFEPDLDGRNHWFGVCEYRRTVRAPEAAGPRLHAVHFGGAMHSARVFLDGRQVASHAGGYLPFEAPLGSGLRDGLDHELRVEIDNRENPDIPPGKPYRELDFCWYGGLYREVELRSYPELHVTDPLSAGRVAGGGLFARTLEASETRALVEVSVHVRNASPEARLYSLRATLSDGDEIASGATLACPALPPGSDRQSALRLVVPHPRLWSVDSPRLHDLHVEILGPDGGVVDSESLRVGIRRIAFSRSEGFQLNGRSLRLRGTNRHQEFPRAGYAMPRAAHIRDARRIKEAGFDYVRLAHYPQSPHFLDACDELGIVVMNAIPGWQYLGGEAFRQACLQNARDLIRRDRNHPCVVLWELSLNETPMDEAFMDSLHAIGHEEYPGDQMFTCGWIDRYDVFTHSRQHGELHRWRNGDKALVVAEYGDWEFYAANDGFDQATGSGLLAPWSSSRQGRANGERGLRQQALNHALALNDTLSSTAALDGQWAVFDYARGYHAERAACGIMDIHRIPKFSYHFYRCQRSPGESGRGWQGGAEVFIASFWTPASDLRVVVFSNCEEVALSLNGTPVARKRPDTTWMTQRLPHPPFLFELPRFVPGTLEAVGFLGGRPAARHRVQTPGTAARLRLTIDDLSIGARVDEPDLLVANVQICDAHGTLCAELSGSMQFDVPTDGATLLGSEPMHVEGGIASAVVRLSPGVDSFAVAAHYLDSPWPMSTTTTWSSPAQPAPQPLSAAS